MAIRMQGTRMRLILHIAAWTIIIGLPLYNFFRWNIPREFIWTYYLLVVINGMIFYGNYLILIPHLFFKNKRLKYYISAFLLILALFFVSLIAGHLIFENVQKLNPRDERSDHVERRDTRPIQGRKRLLRLPFGPMSIYNYAFNALVFTVFAFGLKVLERHSEIEKRQKELEKEKLNSELAFLKAQISPHFFFNTLNNIYSLIEINKEDSQKAILKLSKMMRYLLYESEQGESRLSTEIEFMNNYIDLMRLRVSDKVKLSVSFPKGHDDLKIPPLLFISVIENAFKHGISYREKSFISVHMEVYEKILNFICENSLVTKADLEDERSGIGLENLKKRLGLLFPNRHELNIDRLPSVFRVIIKIELEKT